MKNLQHIAVISLILIGCSSSPKQKPETLKYHIVSKQDNSFMDNSKMVFRVMLDVDSLPTDEEMKNTAITIWENGNQNWNEFSISLYLPDMNTESTEYGIGNFNKDGLSSFFKYKGALSATKWGITKIEEPIETIKETQSEKLKDYKINISAISLGDGKVKINITTNFPDGTNLSLWINRDYYVKGKNEPNGGELGDKDFSIKNGRFETIVIINDTEWYNRYQKVAKAIPDDFPPISKISDKITINALYTAATLQPASVLEILGTRGEFVTGEGSEHFGTGTAGRLTSLRISKEFYFPMEGRIEKESEYANYQSLKVNETYAISKETPLMPEFEPSDPLAAMNSIKYLQAGSRIRILSIETKYNSPWYEVQAMSKTGEGIGKGWVNSTALIGQNILVIR